MTGLPVPFHRAALLELVRGPWQTLWVVTPALQLEALRVLLPHLEREEGQVRVLTNLTHQAIGDGRVELAALQRLKRIANCEVRGIPDLSACVYAAEGGAAIVSGAPLTLEGLDGPHHYGVHLPDSGPITGDLQRWWEQAHQLSPAEWSALGQRVKLLRDAFRVGSEIARLGAFVRVSARGTRRTRKLDPRDFGVVALGSSRIRPVDVLLYKLDLINKAKEELDGVLAERGIEWNGHYLVPRRFLEQEWPGIFASRQRQLDEALHAPECEASLQEQLALARRELTSFLGDLYPLVDSEGLPADRWVEVQSGRIISEELPGTALREAGLEYRVLTILPEDRRSVDEMDLLLQNPRLRSVQLTFPV